ARAQAPANAGLPSRARPVLCGGDRESPRERAMLAERLRAGRARAGGRIGAAAPLECEQPLGREGVTEHRASLPCAGDARAGQSSRARRAPAAWPLFRRTPRPSLRMSDPPGIVVTWPSVRAVGGGRARRRAWR